MGITAAIARKVQLNNQRYDFEMEQVRLNSEKSGLVSDISEYQGLQGSYKAGTPEYGKYDQMIQSNIQNMYR